jgi:hypothetical protein
MRQLNMVMFLRRSSEGWSIGGQTDRDEWRWKPIAGLDAYWLPEPGGGPTECPFAIRVTVNKAEFRDFEVVLLPALRVKTRAVKDDAFGHIAPITVEIDKRRLCGDGVAERPQEPESFGKERNAVALVSRSQDG